MNTGFEYSVWINHSSEHLVIAGPLGRELISVKEARFLNSRSKLIEALCEAVMRLNNLHIEHVVKAGMEVSPSDAYKDPIEPVDDPKRELRRRIILR
jgi:hypothetical protein